jgi:hypothetical protein
MIGFILVVAMAFVLVMAWRRIPALGRIIKKHPPLGVIFGMATIAGAVFVVRWSSGLPDLFPSEGPTGNMAQDVGSVLLKWFVGLGLLVAVLGKFVFKPEQGK